MSNDMTRDDRKALRNGEMHRRRRKAERDRNASMLEAETIFGKPEYPEHAKPLRTSSGMRFGW